MNVLQIAQICHEANRTYAIINGEEQVWPNWDYAPMNIRESAIEGVKKAIKGATPEELHQSWMESKLKDGWKYGPVRDNKNKIHPALVHYTNLPEVQKMKDALFHAIVGALR